MKKFLKILLIISIVAAVCSGGIFAYVRTGHDFTFFENYAQNFSDNLFNLKLKYALKKSEKSEEKQPEEQPLQEEMPSEAETVQEAIESTPSPTTTSAEKNDNKTFSDTETLPKSFSLTCDPMAVEGASNARFVRYGDDILWVSESLITMLDKNGNTKWTEQIQISEPVVKVNGDYILLFEQGGKKFLVYNNKKQIIASEASDNILNGSISSTGESVFVTEKKYYRGAVSVFNKSGEEIFSRSFGTNSVIAAAISDSRRLAVAQISTVGRVNSTVSFLDITKNISAQSVDFEDSVIFDLEFDQNTLMAYSDKQLTALNGNGKVLWAKDYEQKTLSKHQKDENELRLLMFDNNNNAEFSVITSSGRTKERFQTDIIPDYCDICDGYIIYSSGRNLYLTKLTGSPLAKYTSSRDIVRAYFIDSDNILVVYNSSIEFLQVKRGA